MIVTRFAPSPTGGLHVGGLRTAIFNFLYARRFGGKFYLRVEDTDKKRSSDEYLDSIFDGISLLDIKPDKVFYQSKNHERHKQVALLLLQKGLAYKDEGAVRLKINKDGVIAFDDLILGSIKVKTEEVEDVVILRSDGTPTYTLAVVVDDHDMQITHVIRGSDHITNTFKQIALYSALDWDIPSFGHIPLIHNQSGSKLSKRDGATDVTDFKNFGILPQALFNYLLRLGWSHGDKEIFNLKEAADLFDLKNVGKSPACFDMDKLFSINCHYIKTFTGAELLNHLTEFDSKYQKVDVKTIQRIIEIFKLSVKSIKELAEFLSFLIKNVNPESPVDATLLKKLHEMFTNADWQEDLNKVIKNFAKKYGCSPKEVYTNLRLAVVGRVNCPSIANIMQAMTKADVIKKIKMAVNLEK